ncbi:hypothetical protein V2J09_002565 [Rumex salicifolius]
MGLSNNLTAALNFIALICSIPIIASGLWLSSQADNECVHLFRWPVVILGFLVFVVSVIGFMGAYMYKESLLALYLCCMAILIALLITLLVFALVVSRPDGSYEVPGAGFREYRLNGFSSWLKEHVVSDDYWGRIRSCLADSGFCAKLSSSFVTANYFFISHISPLQSGCCKPPLVCGYQYVSPTTWVNPANPTADPDCSAWSNDARGLCYNCSSCRAGLLGNLRDEWRKANIILIVALVVLICVYVLACSAYRNAQTGMPHRK